MILLHFLAPKQDHPDYNIITDGHVWRLLKMWKEVAPEMGVQIEVSYSPKMEEYEDKIRRTLGKYHPLAERTRVLLQVNGHGILLDARDHHSVAMRGGRLRGILSCMIKFQKVSKSDVKDFVVPFTYFTERDHDLLMKYREKRKKIMEDRDFMYSVIWTGRRGKGNVGITPVRERIAKAVRRCSMSRVGRCNSDEEYLDATSKSVVGASGSRNGQFSQRDMDFLAIGTPFFAKKFNIITLNPLLPNTHYYSIGGDEIGIRRTLKHFIRFFEPEGKIRDFSDEEWEIYRNISQAGMDWFDKNASTRGSLQLLLHILERKSII